MGAARRLHPKAQTLAVDLVRLEADLCKSSLYDFVRRFWSEVESADPVWNWHIRVICEVLQEAAERVFRKERKLHDIVINVPPGSTKSLICSVMFPAWVWTRMPHAQTICASYAEDLALDLSMKSRDIIESDKWKLLFGDVQLRQDQKNKSFFKNNAKGWRYCLGFNGTVTGKHAHFIIIDDPLNPKQAVSPAQLKSTNRTISETLSRRKVDSRVTVTITIMQRLHQDDPSAVALRKAEQNGTPIKWVCLPAEVQGSGLREVRPRSLRRHYAKDAERLGWRLLDPVRIDRTVLNQAEVDLGRYGYAGQMLQSPVPLGGGMFKIQHLGRAPKPGKGEFRTFCRYWDKAATAGGGDYTAGVLVGETWDGRFYVLSVVRGQWSSETREDMILSTAQGDAAEWSPDVLIGVEQEPGASGVDSARATVKRLRGFRVRVIKPTGSKELRADPASVQVNGGNVFLALGDWNSDFIGELQFFPHSKNDDQVDGFSGAVNLLTSSRTRAGALFPRKGPGVAQRVRRPTAGPRDLRGLRALLQGR